MRPLLAISLFTLGVIPTVRSQPSDSDTILDWKREVLPSVLSAFCIGETNSGMVPLSFGCPNQPTDPLLAGIASHVGRTISPQQWYLQILLAKATSAAFAGDKASVRAELEPLFRDAIAADTRLMNFLTTEVTSYLGSRGVQWRGDSEQPESGETRKEFRVDDVMPYAALLAWPDQILSGRTPAMHICAAANGLHTLPDPDLRIAAIAISTVTGNKSAVRRMSRALGLAKATPQYKTALTDDDRIAALQAAVREVLTNDDQFKRAIAAQMPKACEQNGARCSDCDEVVSRIPLEASTGDLPRPRNVMRKPWELALEGLSPDEVHAVRLAAPEITFSLSGELSIEGTLELIASATGMKYELRGEFLKNWRGLSFNRWSTTPQQALRWLHNTCGLRYSLAEHGALLVERADSESAPPPCSNPDEAFTPQ